MDKIIIIRQENRNRRITIGGSKKGRTRFSWQTAAPSILLALGYLGEAGYRGVQAVATISNHPLLIDIYERYLESQRWTWESFQNRVKQRMDKTQARYDEAKRLLEKRPLLRDSALKLYAKFLKYLQDRGVMIVPGRVSSSGTSSSETTKLNTEVRLAAMTQVEQIELRKRLSPLTTRTIRKTVR